jgi:2-C-methyl-D-erythritol 4-phosphate cytidylyltransferase
MYKNKKIALILLMGGVGSRFNLDTPKQFYNLSGKKIYLRTLDIFYNLNVFDEIILASKKEYITSIKKEVKDYKNIKVIKGGDTRQESTFKALQTLSNLKIDYVVIHDAVRPFVSKRIILENITYAIKYSAVDTCIPSNDTLVEMDNRFIKTIPNRANFLRGQTPQSFDFNLIYSSHIEAKKNNILNKTDDCSLVLNKKKIFVVKGDEYNIKITTKLDLFLAEQIFRLKLDSPLHNKKRNLENKVFALIGASGDIAKAIKTLLEKEKAIVLSISRTSDYKTDISKYDDVKKTFDLIYKEYGKIDGIINAAGIFIVKNLKKITKKEIDEIINVNLLGLIYTCKLAQIKDKGHIINISSTSSFYGRKNYGIYSSSKAAIINFTQSLSEEMENINVNVVIPQRADTTMRKKYFPNEDKKSLLSTNDIALKIIDILKSDITGSIIEIKK